MTDSPGQGTGALPASEDFRMTEPLREALAGEPVRVGTENAAKCEAVRQALARLLVDPGTSGEAAVTAREQARSALVIVPVGVDSGVAEQPVGFEEIIAGARHRARAALASGPCAMAAGIEDGLVPLPDGLGAKGNEGQYNVGCAWLTDGTREAAGFSSGFAYPALTLGSAVRDREPIGELFDALWRRERDAAATAPSGPRGGNIGKLTGGRLPRSAYGAEAVLCALIRFLQKDLYD